MMRLPRSALLLLGICHNRCSKTNTALPCMQVSMKTGDAYVEFPNWANPFPKWAYWRIKGRFL